MSRRTLLFLGAVVALGTESAAAQDITPGKSRIIGVVSDSVTGRGLQGAEVFVSGISNPVLTDSLGRFSVDGVAPGRYQVGVFHPLLESLGLTLATEPFAVGADSAAVVNLGVPSVPTLVRRYCGAVAAPGGPAVVAGRLLAPDTDAPIAGAKVSLAWTDVSVTKVAGVVRTPHVRQTETDNSGFFRICGIPSSLWGATLQATHTGGATPEVPVELENNLLFYQSLALGSTDSLARKVGTVSGRVQGLDGRPIAGARVEVPAAGVSGLSSENGTFTLQGVATGTQVIVARQLGFDAVRAPINVTSREPTTVILSLDRVINVMDPVLVTARVNHALERTGFNRRKKMLRGHYFTSEEIAKRNPFNISRMLVHLRGITVEHPRIGGAVVRGRGARPGLYTCSHARILVDGFEWRGGHLDDFVDPADVMGLEVYPENEAPMQFRNIPDSPPCPVILVWTHVRGTK